MNIRKVQKSDNKFLAGLIREVFEEHNAPKEGTVYSDPTTDNLYELFKNKKSILWVVEENSEILGCCGIYPTDGLPNHCAELVKFYLVSKARGKKIGTKLMEQNIKSAIELGYSELYIESLSQFDRAVKMYKKLGFKNLEKPLGKSVHTSCNIWMIKKLLDE
ncbi:MAG: GNAT family N-acetyltransferase [Dysgonamonadaceae bacterium]